MLLPLLALALPALSHDLSTTAALDSGVEPELELRRVEIALAPVARVDRADPADPTTEPADGWVTPDQGRPCTSVLDEFRRKWRNGQAPVRADL